MSVFAAHAQIFLNYLSNYLTHEWREGKCVSCVEEMAVLPQELPTVFVGVFVEQPTPFLQRFFERLAALNYPKKKMTVFLRNSVSSMPSSVWVCTLLSVVCGTAGGIPRRGVPGVAEVTRPGV